MNDISRRSVVKSAAWSVPVIAAAIAVPQSAASNSSEPPCKNRAYVSTLGEHDVAIILITGEYVIVQYKKDVDLIDINLHKSSGNINMHIQRKVKAGEKIVVAELKNCEDPTFIQVHGNNTHYYGNGVFR